MVTGSPPFYHDMRSEMLKRIQQDELIFDPSLFDEDLMDLLQQLLRRKKAERPSASQIRRHPWFQNHIDFEVLYQRKVIPPFVPSRSDVEAGNYFDPDGENAAGLQTL